MKLQFGQIVDGYEYKVINERDARASAGIMFLFGIISLFWVILIKDLFWANFFTMTFILEFVVRILIAPRYAPYMILGSLIVSSQTPEWVEARPKKFAWIFGLILGVIMSYFLLFDIITPLRLVICLVCLSLLYMESVFGICLGCIIYKKLNIKIYNCAGGICNVSPTNKKILQKSLIILVYVGVFYGMFYMLKINKEKKLSKQNHIINHIIKSECTPPAWAIKIGHKDMWLKHHGCDNME